MAALDHGEEDLEKRQLIEARVEAERVLHATKKALAADADLLEGEEERTRIAEAIAGLEEAVRGERAALIRGRTEVLDDATHGWAGRRMDRAIAKAIAGKDVVAVEGSVAAARGVEAHLAEHAGGAGDDPAGAVR
jgi:molecular chaperone HscA